MKIIFIQTNKNKFTMLDINGIEIKVGQTVKTMQHSGGVLPSANPKVGVVEKTTDAFGNKTFMIRFREKGKDFDQFILLTSKINEVITSR